MNNLLSSRAAEQEADRIGMQTLNNAGFDPRQSSEFLTKLAAQIRYKYKPPAFAYPPTTRKRYQMCYVSNTQRDITQTVST